MLKVLVAAAIFGAVLTASPASATHDTIYTPCSTEYGYVHMTYEEWAAEITTMEADGTIPPGVVFRYWEANHTTGKGTNVQEDGTIPAWDQWAQNLIDGQILSIDDWLNGDYPEIEALNFSSGKVPEWVLDANMTIRRVDDPYWAQPNPLTPSFTVWGTLCMANLGYSIPLMEVNDDGVWESNLPTTTTIPAVQSPCQTSSGETQYDSNAIHAAVEGLVAAGSISPEHISVSNYGVFIFGMAPTTLVEAGLVQETALGHDGYAYHYTDEYWEYRFEHVPNWSFWEIDCTSTVISATTTTTTTTFPPDPEPVPDPEPIPGPTQEQEAPEPEVPAPTTTAVALTEAPGMVPEQELPAEVTLAGEGETTPTPNDAPYTLFDAEWDGYPFEATVRLLEDRYPIGVEGKTYFKLSAAVEYLRAGGMVRGLDNLWNS